uniref:Uncharacterized protein n=1 Tax=Anguilla anguilla TaxID=7936 RepID=A0A0E9SLA8_ANGAN
MCASCKMSCPAVTSGMLVLCDCGVVDRKL